MPIRDHDQGERSARPAPPPALPPAPPAPSSAGVAGARTGFTARNVATLKAIIDAVDSLVVVARIEGSLLLWNRRCEESSGVPFAEVTGKPLWDVMRLRSRLRVEAQAAFDRLVSGQERRISFLSQWVRKDGRKARIAWTAELVAAAEEARFIVATGSETTRGKRAAREFAETEARYETLLDLLPEAVAVHQDGRVVFVNRAAASLYGASDPREMLGLGVWDFVAPSHRNIIRDRVAGIVKEGGTIEASRERHLRRDGTEFDVEAAAKPVVFNGRPAVEVVVRDISERVAAESARAESEARMRAIFHDSAIGMLLADREGRSLESNEAFHRLLGYEQSELAQMPFLEYTYEGDREPSGSALADLFDGRVDRYELVKRYVRKDGTLVWTRVHVGAVRDSSGTPSLAVVTVEDITEAKELEEHLRQGSKMEALGRLAGGVAHDFNNLLTVVNGYAEILVASLEGDERAADAMEIRRAGARGRELTAQLLAFGRRAPRSVERIDLNDRIGALIPMLRRLLGEDIEFEVTLDQRLGFVETDPSQLDQVVMNLVVNARDAMPSGGELKLTTGLLPPAPAGAISRTGLPWARIEIVDTGFGMAPEVIDRIFEPFFTTKNLGHGTGLGLATVYGIVEQMGGHIHVFSTVAVGSTFQVDLPLSSAVASTPEAALTASSRRGSETVLLVEDEPAVRDFCKRALEAEGYRVVATGPRGAVEEATALGASLDLLLSDVVMPELDGPTIAAALTARRPGLPVLFMSGYPRDREGEISGAAAAGAVLSKPFDARQLAEAVRRALDRRTPDVGRGRVNEAAPGSSEAG